MQYRTVLLDADGTLLDFDRSEKEALREALMAINAPATDEVLATYSRINDGFWKMLERGEIEKKDLYYRRFEELFARFGIEGDAKAMGSSYMEKLSHKGYLLEGAEELCRKLFGKCRLYIVTNGTEFIQRGRYAVSGIDRYFDGVFISDVIGTPKPNRGFFEAVAMGIPDFRKEETLIVGDSLTSDIKGGMDFGIHTCWYNPKRKATPDAMEGRITCVVYDFESVYAFIEKGEMS